jgi:hypothetical protein
MQKLGDIELLSPICNPSTLDDGRGGIFSWIPSEAIQEFTLLFFNQNKSRGNHYHPEFIEYFLVLEGVISLTTFDKQIGKRVSTIGGVGFCFKTPEFTPHLVKSLTNSKCISLITKPWDECERPIVYEDLES